MVTHGDGSSPNVEQRAAEKAAEQILGGGSDAESDTGA